MNTVDYGGVEVQCGREELHSMTVQRDGGAIYMEQKERRGLCLLISGASVKRWKKDGHIGSIREEEQFPNYKTRKWERVKVGAAKWGSGDGYTSQTVLHA